jgi:hypothetical protein
VKTEARLVMGERLSFSMISFFFFIKCKNFIDKKEQAEDQQYKYIDIKREQTPLIKPKARLAC